MSTAKIVGENLKEARKFKGFTQKDVAEKMKMTQQQYSRFENGVFELLRGEWRDRTVIFISHRDFNTGVMDRIVKIEPPAC